MYGVPQTRRRAILIARWAGENRLLAGDPHLPEPTHHHYRKGHPRTGFDVDGWVAMEDVLTGRKGQRFKVVSNYGTGGDPRARGERLHGEPSATVTGKISRNRVVTLDGDRELERFSISEAGQLQTFPPEPAWKWRGGDIAQQIGNAVPPLLGLHILASALDVPADVFVAARAKHHPYAVPRPKPS
jgi:DNA (cytosine-5)-methyltransferase 1